MESTLHQESPAKKQCTEEHHPIVVNQFEPIPPQDPENELTVENAAFSQYPIFKNILSFLNPEDLETCWYVSKHWREVSGPWILVHYNIEIDTISMNSRATKPIILTERARYNRKSLKRYELDFEGATKMLEETLLTEKVELSLSFYGLDVFCRSSSIEDILTKFGPLVQHLAFYGVRQVPLKDFSNFLLTKFPNAKSLNCAYLWLIGDSPTEHEYFNPDLPKYQHKNLKKIDFGMYIDSSVETLGKFLKTAPNLEEIQKLPVWLINSVVVADKVLALKSLSYHVYVSDPFAQNGMTVVSAFEKLAQLQPKLSSFSLLCGLEDETTMERIKPFLSSILQSSAHSLRSFEIGCTEWYGFQGIPQLKELKTLVFSTPNESFVEGKCFAPNFSHQEILPNVSEICFRFDLYEYSINQYFPEIPNFDWGCQIKQLNVWHLPMSTLRTLAGLFPQIEDLGFSGSANEISELLPAFPNSWSQLRSMNILVTDVGIPKKFLRPGPELLDCAFTGLSPEVVVQLLDPSKRAIFSDAEITNWKSQSTICKLKELQRLTLTLDNRCTWITSDKVYPRLTHVSYEFGFRLLPHLNVSVSNLKI